MSASPDPLLKPGERHPAVHAIRELLQRAGVLDSHSASAQHPDAPEPDSELFDRSLEIAVRHFQQARGLKADGIVGPLTWRRAREARWRLGDRPLHHDATSPLIGDDVAALQRKLNDLGFDAGRVDGIFGPRTGAAVTEFQLNLSLDPTGVCDETTLEAFANLARAITGGRPEALRESHEWRNGRTGLLGKVVVLDPGHGDEDLGCQGNGVVEADVVVDVAERVERHLAQLGVVVLLTRGRSFHHDRVLDDAARAAFANSVAADAVISLHIDQDASSHASGASAYFYGSSAGSGSEAGRHLAASLLDHICAGTGLPELGCYPRSWDLLRLTRMPSVRVYLGYSSNPADAALLLSGDFREQLAAGIAAAVAAVFTPASLQA